MESHIACHISSYLPNEVLLQHVVSRLQTLELFCVRWTCKVLRDATPKQPKSDLCSLITEAATADNSEMFDALMEISKKILTPPLQVYSAKVGGISHYSPKPADFFGFSAPVYKLIELCTEGATSLNLVKFMIVAKRPAVEIGELFYTVDMSEFDRTRIMGDAVFTNDACLITTLTGYSPRIMQFTYARASPRFVGVVVEAYRVHTAIRGGNIEFLQWLFENVSDVDVKMLDAVAWSFRASDEIRHLIKSYL